MTRLEESIRPIGEKNSSGSKFTNIASTDGDSTFAAEIKEMRNTIQAQRDAVKGYDPEVRRRAAEYDAPSVGEGKHEVSEQVDCKRARETDTGWLTMMNPSPKYPTYTGKRAIKVVSTGNVETMPEWAKNI